MKFNVYLTIKGPEGSIEAPVVGNPMECANLASLMVSLANNLPRSKALGTETVGIRIELVKDVSTA